MWWDEKMIRMLADPFLLEANKPQLFPHPVTEL